MNVRADGCIGFKIEAAEVVLLFVRKHTFQIFLNAESHQRVVYQTGIIAIFDRIPRGETNPAPGLPRVCEKIQVRFELRI